MYGDSLKLDDIRIHKGNLSHKMGAEASHTVGNDIYLADDCWNADGSLNEKGRMTLVHEAFHVYQAQKGGNDYMHEALLWQVGDRKTAYEWTVALREGKPFNEWNPEQQAEFMETLARAKEGKWGKDSNNDGVPDKLDKTYDLNKNGRIDKNELELAWGDLNGDGTKDPSSTRNTYIEFTDKEFEQIMAIWETIKADRPDRAVI